MTRRVSSFLPALVFALIVLPGSLLQAEPRSSGTSTAKPDRNPAVWQREEVVAEPVFKGTVYIARAGMENASTIVLVHGMGDDAARDWEPVVPDLSRKYRVIAFDLPGFGRSSRGNNLYSPEEYSAFINWVADRYAGRKFILIGHSMGGAIALTYASLHPERLERLVLVDAAGILHHVSLSKELLANKGPASVLPIDGIVRRVLDNLSNEERAGKFEASLSNPVLRQVLLSGDPKQISGSAMMMEDYASVVDRVTTPAILVWGGQDQIAPLRTAHALFAMLPEARLRIISGADHVPMQTDPGKFTSTVLEELASTVTATPAAPAAPVTPLLTLRHERRKNFTVSGSYRTIELVNCEQVKLIDVVAEEIVLRDSTVTMENVVVRGNGVGLSAIKSEVIATSVRIEADTALQMTRSRFDGAGVRLTGRKASATADDRSILVFSISKAASPRFTGPLQGKYRVTGEKPL